MLRIVVYRVGLDQMSAFGKSHCVTTASCGNQYRSIKSQHERYFSSESWQWCIQRETCVFWLCILQYVNWHKEYELWRSFSYIYINDLSRICKYTTPILFADNTNTFLNGGDLKQMETAINEELLNISKWLKANKLSLNVKKPTTWYLLKRNLLGIY